MDQRPKTIAEFQQVHPFPWSEVVLPNGQVMLLDAGNREVGLFYITALCMMFTNAVAARVGIP